MRRVAFLLHDLSGQWLGGLNYYRSLITAIAMYERARVTAVLFASPSLSSEVLSSFGDVECIRTSLLSPLTPAGLTLRVTDRASGLAGAPLLPLLRRHHIDILSHAGSLPLWGGVRTLGWIPDFQHLHLHDFFPRKEWRARDRYFRRLWRRCDGLVVSSQSALHDLKKIAPEAADRTSVLHFSPQIEIGPPALSIEQLEGIYKFKAPYFHLPNQFWAHKNHAVVIEALAEIVRRGRQVLVLATGQPSDYRNPHHYGSLMSRVDELGLQSHFRSLGVVPYPHMLALMRHSLAVINPSMFEGWSTTVEEAKAHGKTIVLSDLPVHREQAPARGVFFDPHDAIQLADALEAVTLAVDDRLDFEGYEETRKDFAARYVEIIETLRKK